MNDFHWFVLNVNPEPWAVGPLSIGRRGGKMFATMGRNQQLWTYQQAVKEEIGESPSVWIEGPVQMVFYFWRRRDEYSTHQARTHRKHEADATNMQKALEDALQGVLFKNDKDTNDIRSVIVEQGPDVQPKVVVAIKKSQKLPEVMAEFPQQVHELLDSLESEGNMEWLG